MSYPEVQYDHGNVKSWELSIPELRNPMRAILDCPERLFVAWHRHAIGIHELLDEDGCMDGFSPQPDLWEVREYRRTWHLEGYSASYERVSAASQVPQHAQGCEGR